MMARFLGDARGTVAVEYLVVAALVVAVVGSALFGLFNTLRGKVQEVNGGL